MLASIRHEQFNNWRVGAAVAAFLTFLFFLSSPFRGSRIADPTYTSIGQWNANNRTTNLTVNVVIASIEKDSIDWTTQIENVNLRVIRYLSDSNQTQYHPPVLKKGREALIYHTYFHDFYDNLPDISIMIHPDEHPWHIESALKNSLAFAIQRLDLNEVLHRGYFNLRASWEFGCNSPLDPSRPPEESQAVEELYIKEGFRAIFGTYSVPDSWAGPCCSQFAVTREAIRGVEKSQYKRVVRWLSTTEQWDAITGRLWEHFWPWLFNGVTVDCKDEKVEYCTMYHLCYKDTETIKRLNGLDMERWGLTQKLEDPEEGPAAKRRLREIERYTNNEVAKAARRGGIANIRYEAYGNGNGTL